MFTGREANRGEMTHEREPNWNPLLALAPDEVDDFMWMFAVELESGLRLHAFKHIETRRYLHLDSEGRAFVYQEPNLYREVEPERILRLVLKLADDYEG
jgi:hypothetical protein